VTEQELSAAVARNNREIASADRVCFWFFGIVKVVAGLALIAGLTLFVKLIWYL